MSIYLDFNATMPMLPEVKSGLISIMEKPLNSSSAHLFGRNARAMIENTRLKLKKALDIPDNYRIVFTSCGTEANNLAVNGMRHCVGTVITSTIEHASILQTIGQGIINVNKNAYFLEDSINHSILFHNTNLENINLQNGNLYNKNSDKDSVRANFISQKQQNLYSLILANNEVGTIQDIANISKSIHHNGDLIHTDASQAIGKIPLSIKNLGVDMLTISGHKFGAPLGSGALIYREELNLKPIIYGGGQEYRLRSGTVNAFAVYGMGIACDYIQNNCNIMQTNILHLRNFIEEGILSSSYHDKNHNNQFMYEEYKGNYIQNGFYKPIVFARFANRLPNTISIAMPNVPAEIQIAYFDNKGIAVSAGSACSSAKTASIPHVQMAMGYDHAIAKCAIRVSLGPNTTLEEAKTFVHVWQELYKSTI